MNPPRIAAALAGLGSSLALLGPSPLLAAGGDLVWTFQGIEDVICADEIEDQNADGVPDLVVETYDAGAVGDHLYCLSGASPGPAPVTIWSVKPPGGPSNSGGNGDKCVQVAPDLDGDGIDDVLLGTAWGGRTAYALRGTDGSVIWDFDTYADHPPNPSVSGWVYAIVHVPDVNGDLVPDVFFTCGSDNNRVYHASGADGAILYDLELADAVFCAAGLDDVSGDGLPDGVFGVGDLGDSIWCLRGNGPPLLSLWDQTMPGTVYAVARIADISGDGVNDVLAGTWDSSVYCFNGVTGGVEWISSFPGFAYVMRIAVLDDVDGDGFEDAAIATWDNRAFVISGADGDEIWSTPAGGDVWAIERIEDVTGDGINDVVAGSFDQLVYLLDGTTGAVQWTFPTGNRLYYVMGISDLTGNGVPDVFAGSQFLSSPGGQGFLLEGGESATSADLPAFVEASSDRRGVLLQLRNADEFTHTHVERIDGRPNDEAAAQRFRLEVAAAYEDGLLTVREAIGARSQDPAVKWTRISTDPVTILQGQATYLDRSAQTGHTYTYRFAYVFEGVVVGYSPVVTVRADGDDRLTIPSMRAWPNPLATEHVSIEFQLAEAQNVKLEVFDAGGRRVATLQDGPSAGSVHVDWNGRDAQSRPLPNGVYFVRLEGRDFVAAEKITILR